MKEIKSLNKDIVFKIVFKSVKEATAYLLKCAVNIDISDDDICFMDTEVEPSKHNEKLIIADVLFNINESKYFCVEMQNVLHSNFTKRLEFYLARIINNLIKKKRKYKTFPSLYSIAFINDKKRFKKLFTFATTFDKIDTGMDESNDNLFNFIIINLAFIEKYIDKYPKKLISLLKLIRTNDQEEMKILSKESKLNEQIYEKMCDISEDDALVALIDTYEMAELDDELRSISDKREGEIIGKYEGKYQEKITNAINLLDILDDETISNKIELDLNLVKKLRSECQNKDFDIKNYL